MKHNNQGKRPDQIETALKFAAISFLIAGMVLFVFWLIGAA